MTFELAVFDSTGAQILPIVPVVVGTAIDGAASIARIFLIGLDDLTTS